MFILSVNEPKMALENVESGHKAVAWQTSCPTSFISFSQPPPPTGKLQILLVKFLSGEIVKKTLLYISLIPGLACYARRGSRLTSARYPEKVRFFFKSAAVRAHNSRKSPERLINFGRCIRVVAEECGSKIAAGQKMLKNADRLGWCQRQE